MSLVIKYGGMAQLVGQQTVNLSWRNPRRRFDPYWARNRLDKTCKINQRQLDNPKKLIISQRQTNEVFADTCLI